MSKTNLIGISGYIGSGKDLVGKIIQYLTTNDKALEFKNNKFEDFLELSNEELFDNDGQKQLCDWEVKKFADKLKDIVCLLIGCTRENLEDQDFKNKELGEEWFYYKGIKGTSHFPYLTINEFKNLNPHQKTWYELFKLTPRSLLQLLGTDCGRKIIHPNIWINSLFSDYFKPCSDYKDKTNCLCYRESDNSTLCESQVPNWIITDMRFPNEMKAIKDRNGITIRVNRQCVYDTDNDNNCGLTIHCKCKNRHESETALDNTEFDYIIENNRTIDELIQKVKEILIKEEII